ncbi:hypothetical protein [Streptomyces sp. F001]|uniref:hypothetical protein n=1 Tax=Streptomyces sp. F001 TaxID=1510026 RepID=UPI0026B7C16B
MPWRLRRNPLRRRTDLWQAWIALGLLLTVPAATPAAMILTGDIAHRHYTRTAQHQAQTRHERAQIRKHQRRAARAPKGSPAKTAEYAKVKARESDRRKDW